MTDKPHLTEAEQSKFVLEKTLTLYSETIERLKAKEVLIFVFTMLSLFAGAGIAAGESLKMPLIEVKVEKSVAAQYLLLGAAACIILRTIDFLNAKLLRVKIEALFERNFSGTREMWAIVPVGYLAFGNRLKSAGL